MNSLQCICNSTLFGLQDLITKYALPIEGKSYENSLKKMQAHKDKGRYLFVPYRDIIQVIEQLIFIKDILYKEQDVVLKNDPFYRSNYLPYKFVDAGCGLGFICHLAWNIGFKAYGIEIYDSYLKFCKKFYKKEILKYNPTTFIREDILKHDYKQYDIIYYFCPFTAKNLERRFEKRVLDTMKKGAFLIPKEGAWIVEEDKRFKKIKIGDVLFTNMIFRKIKE